MSEDEQSWSFSDSQSNLRRGRVLVCAMAIIKPDARWPMDDRDFSKAVDRLTEKGNPIAQSIRVYPGIAGRHCPDFREMLSYALSSCLIEYLAPAFEYMLLNISPSAAKRLSKDVSEDEMAAARELVQEFWNVHNGEPLL